MHRLVFKVQGCPDTLTLRTERSAEPGHFESREKFVEDEIQRYLADFPQIFSFDKQRELISQFKFLLNQAKAEKFGTQCDDAWSCLGPVLKQGIRGLNRTV